MEIPLGNGMVEPIYILCKEKVKHRKEFFWSGIIKPHLLNPTLDAINMLRGIRPFILNLDDKSTLGKVYKTWDSIARNNLLSCKVDNPLLLNTTSNKLHFEVLAESFRRGYDYEVTSVQKNTGETWAWLIAATPKKAKNMEKYKIPYLHEVMHVITPLTTKAEARESRGPRITKIELKKRNATMLCVNGLHKMKKIEDIISSINAIVGEKNVVSYYFLGRVGELHIGSANLQCLNPTVYKQFLYKTREIYGKYVTFAPHLRSLEGTAPPTKEKHDQFGFNDISSTLASTIEAIKNAPQPQIKRLSH